MNQKKRCAKCGCLFRPNPCVKNQRYCRRQPCQRDRKTFWQKQKMAADPDYEQNQKESQQNWFENNPNYWRNYRRQSPEYCRRNRLLQMKRDQKRRPRTLAKMDSLKRDLPIKPGSYYLVPLLAKMDSIDNIGNFLYDEAESEGTRHDRASHQ